MGPAPQLPADCHLCGDAITSLAAGIDVNGERDWWAFTWDHITPRSLGGSDEPENLRPAHLVCNIRRKNMPLDEWQAARRWEQAPVSQRTFECLPRPCIQCGEPIDQPRAMQLLHRGECTRLRSLVLSRESYARRKQQIGGKS